MDNGSIFSKTGKGSLEITKKTIKLSSEERQALILVDGKTNFGELQEKLARIPPPKLRAVFDKLASLELIREFVARAAPASSKAASEASSAPSVATLDADAELDFTALMSPASAKTSAPAAALDFSELAPASNTSTPVPKPATTGAPTIDAAEEARKFQEMMFGGGQADQAAEAAKKTEADAALRKAEAARKVAEDQARRKAEAERVAREEAARKAAEDEARQRAETERVARDEAARKSADEDARRKAEAERIVREEAARKTAEDEARRKAAEQAERERMERDAREREEAARRAAEEEARRKAEAEQVAREEAARKAAENEARRKAAEQAERERIERDAREREEAARRAAEEEARRKAEAERVAREEAARKAAEEEARRKALEQAERERIEREAREREAAARRAAEEEARRNEEAERLAREDAARRAEAERIAREEAARKAAVEEGRLKAAEEAERERIEREERARREAEQEARRQAEAERTARETREREETARRAVEEETRRKAEADRVARDERERQEREQLARNQAERRAAEESAHRQTEAAQRAAIAAEQQHKADQEAAQYVTALTPQIDAVSAAPAAPPEPASLDFNAEAKASFDADLNFAPKSEEEQRKSEVDRLMMGAFADAPLDGAKPLTGNGPDTFADNTGNTVDPQADNPDTSRKALESASRKEIEREAKERAKADAKAKKEAEKEAKRIAKESRVKVRRGGPSVMTMSVGAALVAMAGAVAYLFLMPIDKPAIERTLTERLGEPVTIGAAKFSPFPPQLDLSNVLIGSIKLRSVIASPDPATLITDRKIWKSVEVSGISLSADDARKLASMALREVPKSAAAKAEIQRVKFNGAEITGSPLTPPKFDVVVLLTAAGALKQVTLSTTDGKAQVLLGPDDKGWTVDIESRGMIWPAGPKIAWESVRAKGLASANGIKFDEYTLTQFGGSARGAGDLSWSNGWKFAGNLDVSALEAEAIGLAFYGTAPVSGAIDGKFVVGLSGNSLARLFDAPQIDGAFIANKAVVKSIDLARTAQTGAAAAGATRFSDFSATLAVASGKLQVKELKGISGLLTVSGMAEVQADKTLGGALTVELGVGGSRAKAIVKLSGTLAEPKLTK